MHSYVLKFLGALMFLGATIPSMAQSQVRIGYVDMKKVFEGYHRTKEAEAKIKDEFEVIKKNGDTLLEDYKRSNEQYKQLVEAANDTAISSEEKQRRKKAAEDKLLDIRALEQQIKAFDNQSRATLEEKRRRMITQIVKEIREMVVTRAKAAGYTLVIDSSAESISQTPVILYTTGENDLTDELLKQLNKDAPAGFTTPAASTRK